MPDTPVTVAPSASEFPRTTDVFVGEVVTPGVAFVTLKHSRVVDPSEAPE
jgi:hypothetical protein